MAPRVSICIPNRNTRLFLEERRESILRQTYKDWEVVVVDDGSTDGAWEFFQQWAAADARVSVHQGPGQGLYAGWNDAIQRARGELVYIATSDDTMDATLLEKLVAALDRNPGCDIAQCELRIIDATGKPDPADGWSTWRQYFPEMAGRSVVRLAPFDGLLHFALRTVYTSINQLLIRRKVFDRTGWFDTQLGSTADFEWGMRAGLLHDVVYVPEALAAWRKHAAQVTAVTDAESNMAALHTMSEVAYNRARLHLARPLSDKQLYQFLALFHEQSILRNLEPRTSPLARGRLLVSAWLSGQPAARASFIARHLFGGGTETGGLKRLLTRSAIPFPFPAK